MNKLLSSLLGALPVVGPVIAAAPEFKRLFDTAKSLLGPQDQKVAQDAYDLAISDAQDAHADLQALVKQYG